MARSLRTAGWVAGVTLGVSGLSGAVAGPVASHTITIEDMQFKPAHLSVQHGDRIVWVNKDLFPHTVTAAGKAFDSGGIEAGSSWTYVADQPGDYPYSCTFHPTMKGSVTVR